MSAYTAQCNILHSVEMVVLSPTLVGHLDISASAPHQQAPQSSHG